MNRAFRSAAAAYNTMVLAAVGLLTFLYTIRSENNDFAISAVLYVLQVLVPLFIARRLVQHPDFQAWNRSARWWFAASLVSLSMGDLLYFSLIFIFKQPGSNPVISLLTTVPYSLCYILGSIGYLKVFRKLNRTILLKPVFWIFPIVAMLFSTQYLIFPLVHLSEYTALGLNKYMVLIQIPATVMILSAAFYTLISAADLGWALFSVGYFTLAMTDWNINVELLNKTTTAISFNGFMWTFAGFLMLIPFLYSETRFGPKVEFDPKSIKSSLRLAMMAACSLPLWFVSRYSRTDLTSILVVSVGFVFIAISVTLLIDYVVSYFSRISEVLSEVITGRLEEKDLKELSAEFPSEYRNQILDVLGTLLIEKREVERQQMLASQSVVRIASQVAHDIRSPLAAIAVVEKELQKLPEETRVLMKSAITRIRDIAAELSATSRGENVSSTARENVLLSGLVDKILIEKKIQYRYRSRVEIEATMDASSYGLFAAIVPSEFGRLLSNVVNNSVEAIESAGRVEISLQSADDCIFLKISDNGKGIPQDVVPKLGGRGETYGKSGGSGLGLHHARKNIESWGGKFELQSREGQGTVVTLSLPRAEAPAWFVSELSIPADASVVILDDDVSVHEAWDRRFDSLDGFDSSIRHFSNPEQMLAWANHRADPGKVLYLMDYELQGYVDTGLDVIEKLGIGSQSILVTSHFDETDVRERCTRLGVRLIPKSMVGWVPMSYGIASHVISTRMNAMFTFNPRHPD